MRRYSYTELKTTDEETGETESLGASLYVKESQSELPQSTLSLYLNELKIQSKLAWPLILMALFRFANPLISIMICGRLSKTEFDAAALANTVINVFGNTIDLGFSTACDTLFSQIYGSNNKKRMGYVLQRAIIVMTIIYILLCCFHMNMEPILILLQQDYKIVQLTANYVQIYLPGLFFDFQFLAISRYLQNQNIVLPMMLSALGGSVFNALSQYIAIYHLGFGIYASAALQATGCFVMFMLQLGYVLISKVYQETWPGFNVYKALSGWSIFFSLGLPGIVMLGVETWAYEAINFVAGSMGEDQLGGQAIAFQVEFMFVTIYSGFGIAILIRVGQCLGAYSVSQLKLSIRVAYMTTVTMSVFAGLIILFGRRIICTWFTDVKEIQNIGAQILIIISFFQLGDAICCVSGGILRACGRQFLGAIITVIAYFIIGIPLGIVFVFVIKTSIEGMWLGLLVGFLGETLVFLTLVFRTNWIGQCEKIKSSETLEFEKEFMTKSAMQNEYDQKKDLTKGDGEIESKIDGTDPEETDQDDTETELLIPKDKVKEDYKTKKSNLFKTRSWQLGIVMLIFATSLSIRFGLPAAVYTPCVAVINSQQNMSIYTQTLMKRNYPFCNHTIYGG